MSKSRPAVPMVPRSSGPTAPRPLAAALLEHVRAASPGIWVQSYEHEDAIEEICRLAAAQDEPWTVATWDLDRGLRLPGRSAPAAGGQEAQDGQDEAPPAPPPTANDPIAAIKALARLAPDSDDGATLLVLPNFHRLIDSAELVQVLADELWAGRSRRTFVVVLSPIVKLPVELERMFVVIDHPLPGPAELIHIALSVASADELPAEGADRIRLLEAAAGMTRMECESALALSLVRSGRVDVQTVWEAKAAMLRRSGLLRLHRGAEKFADLGGLDALKQFCQLALRQREEEPGTRNPERSRTGDAAVPGSQFPVPAAARPRGVLLLGVPGTGKSAFAKALGNETGRPTVTLDVGALYGSLVGQTEANVRNALAIADAMAPCVLFVDEIEKALSGAESSGRTDSGVSARLFGTLLTWLSDHESDVFVVATSNDVSKLPPEFSRAERWDGVWFIELPTEEERQAIWAIHMRAFGVQHSRAQAYAEGWTGAEIRSCCRLAALLGTDLPSAARNVVPVISTAAESVQRLRQWATGRCLDATWGGIYTRDRRDRPAEATQPSGPRRVARAGAGSE